jgi:phosphonate transport system substrate-binding protein
MIEARNDPMDTGISASHPIETPGIRMMHRMLFVLALLGATLLGCERGSQVKGPRFGPTPPVAGTAVYSLAVHPLHNPVKLTQAYQPLVDHLNNRLRGARLALEASRDYANFEGKYRIRKPEFLLANPWQTLQAMKNGYRVIAMAGEPRDFKGIFVARRDGPLTRPLDLRGKRVSYPSPTALAACVMPQFFLHQHGINVAKDIENRYVGSQESSILNVYLGLTTAGATWPPPWRAFQKDHPREAAELKVIWETESLVNNSVMARDDVPSQVVEQVRALLLGLGDTPEGEAILTGIETSRFLPAANEDYDIVRRYVSRFEQKVRRVDQP